jgi:hypothetical protein
MDFSIKNMMPGLESLFNHYNLNKKRYVEILEDLQ